MWLLKLPIKHKIRYTTCCMARRPTSKLNPKKRYLQVALNSTLEEARKIISQLPISERILVEAGTPLIKKYGEDGIRQIRNLYQNHIIGQSLLAKTTTVSSAGGLLGRLIQMGLEQQKLAEERT